MWTSNMISNFISAVTTQRNSGNIPQATNNDNSIRYSEIRDDFSNRLPGRNFALPLDLEDTVTCFCRLVQLKVFILFKRY